MTDNVSPLNFHLVEDLESPVAIAEILMRNIRNRAVHINAQISIGVPPITAGNPNPPVHTFDCIMEKLKVFIADDHNIVRKGMTRLLSTFERVDKVMEASNGKELIRLVQNEQPHAVILDLEMPEMGGYDCAHYVLDHFPDVKILILSMHAEDGLIIRLMDLGVHGVLTKSSEPQEVETALYSIVDNDFFKSKIMDKAVTTMKKYPAPQSQYKLTNREMEVLLLICQELSPSEISNRLNISEKTFFNHRTSVIIKTNSRNNVGLYKFAIQHGYLN